jgi:hypothetical protein
LKNHAQVFGHFGQVPDIFLNQLWRPVVMIQHCQYLIHNGMVGLPKPNVDAEESMDDTEDQAVDEMSNGRADSLLVVEAHMSAIGRLLAVLLCRVSWEIWLQHALAFLRGQLVAIASAVGVEGV